MSFIYFIFVRYRITFFHNYSLKLNTYQQKVVYFCFDVVGMLIISVSNRPFNDNDRDDQT